jgi:hypothetical protein
VYHKRGPDGNSLCGKGDVCYTRSMSSNARVLTGLMERRALEAAFAQLAETTSLEQLVERAQAIAQQGSAAVPLLLSLLDTPDPQLRGGLGQVAAHLEPDQIVPALRNVARARDKSDQARLTALMILERFLNQQVDESLLVGLQDPDTVALQSLRELVHEMEHNSFVVIEYLNQLAEQPADVAQTVLDVVPRLPPDQHLITLLRMFAQGEDRSLAQAALELLSRIRSQDAALALISLSATLPPHQAALAARSLRKLRLSGVPEPDTSTTSAEWRALLSPVDGTGAQVIWFVRRLDAAGRGALFSILCRDPDGIVASFGSLDASGADLPPEQVLGDTYTIQQTSDAPSITLLEVPFDVARRAVREGLELNWQLNRLPPLEYRLLNYLVWESGPLPLNAGEEPVSQENQAVTAAIETVALLDHPALVSWYWQTPELYDAAQKLGRRYTLAERLATIDRLITDHFVPELSASYRRRLINVARWLVLASQPAAAALAQAAADQLASMPPVHNPFLHRLVGQGLDVATANLRSGLDLRRVARPIA